MPILRPVSEPGIMPDRHLGEAELAQVRSLLAGHPDWSRRPISQPLTWLWDWRRPAGQCKDIAARARLLKLAKAGWLYPLRPDYRQVLCAC